MISTELTGDDGPEMRPPELLLSCCCCCCCSSTRSLEKRKVARALLNQPFLRLVCIDAALPTDDDSARVALVFVAPGGDVDGEVYARERLC